MKTLRPVDGRTPNDVEILFNDFLKEQDAMRRARPSTLDGYLAAVQLFLRIVPEADLNNMQMRETWVGFFSALSQRERLVGTEIRYTGVKSSTILTYMSKLNVFMRWLHTTGHIKKNPMDSLERPHASYVDRRFFTESELQRIEQSCRYDIRWGSDFIRIRNHTMLRVLLFTGIRKGELLGLTLEDVNLEYATLTVRSETSKSKKRRQVPIPRELMIDLRDYLRARKDNPVAYTTPALWVSDSRNRAFTVHGIKHVISNIAKNSGVHVHIHRFRHTFASELNRHGVSFQHLQALMGHTDPKMTLAYGRNVSVDTLRADVEKIGSDGYSR